MHECWELTYSSFYGQPYNLSCNGVYQIKNLCKPIV